MENRCILHGRVFVMEKVELLAVALEDGNYIRVHYANTPMQYTAIFQGCKNVPFQMNFLDIFLIFAQNID